MGCTSIKEKSQRGKCKNNLNNDMDSNSKINLSYNLNNDMISNSKNILNINNNMINNSNNNLNINNMINDSNNNLNNSLNNNTNMNLNNNLQNVRSIYILKKIFNIIQKNKQLGIIRYNKKLQKRFNLNFNDYKEYSELYSYIEVETKPTINENGTFINISESEKEYYHIYFDDKIEEIKRNYLIEEDKVNKIKIKIDYQVKSFNGLFKECKCIESMYFSKFYRINITDMSDMFSNCSSLKELKFYSFNTINVADMSNMFEGCSSLKELI